MMTMPISSQAKACKRALEGSETSSRAKAVMLPRVPNIQSDLDGDIVRYSDENRRGLVNSTPVDYKDLQVLEIIELFREEYNQIQGYGTGVGGGFIDEGDLPEERDSSYERKFSVVKYLGITRRVTHVNMASLAA